MSKASDVILSLAKIFDNKCQACFRPCKKSKGFTIHHLDYQGELGKVTYKIFHKKFGRKYKDPYYTALEPLVRKYPKRFKFLHNSCHQTVTRLRRWKDNQTIERLCKIAQETKE